MKNKFRTALAIVILISIISICATPFTTKATCVSEIPNNFEKPLIYLILEKEPDFLAEFKQPSGNKQCTLFSNVLMFRVAAYLSGIEAWRNFTPSGCEAAWWTSTGCPWELSCWGLSANTWSSDSYTAEDGRYYPPLRGKTAAEKKAAIHTLLDQHPEGIVLYAHEEGTSPHAVYLTHYDKETGELYCFDPASPDTAIIRLVDSVLATTRHCGSHYSRACVSEAEILAVTAQYWSIYSGMDYSNIGRIFPPKVYIKNASVCTGKYKSVSQTMIYDNIDMQSSKPAKKGAKIVVIEEVTLNNGTQLLYTVDGKYVLKDDWKKVSCFCVNHKYKTIKLLNDNTVNNIQAFCTKCGHQHRLHWMIPLSSDQEETYIVTGSEAYLCYAPYSEAQVGLPLERGSIISVHDICENAHYQHYVVDLKSGLFVPVSKLKRIK